MRYINRRFFYKFDRTWCGVVIIPNCKCAFTLHKWPNQESQTNKKLILLSETTSRPFFFSSASLRSNRAEKGTWKLTGRGNHLIIEPEIWKLSTPINYQHLWRPCNIVRCGLQIWNIYCIFVYWKHSAWGQKRAGVFDLEVLDSN